MARKRLSPRVPCQYRLTHSGQFDNLVFGPDPGGGSDAIRPTTSPRLHHAARRRGGGVTAGGARSAVGDADRRPLSPRSPEESARLGAAFRKGLNETGTIEGQNVTVEYHWLSGQFERLSSLMADLVRRRVPVIATPAFTAAAPAAKAATTTIPIVFGVAEDPVKLGLVASLARPGGNATGVNFFFDEVVAKRLGLLHDLVPKAVRIAVLVNPASAPITETMLRDMPEAARALGLQVQFLNASTSPEIEAAFATIARDRADALFVAPDSFFTSRRDQFARLAARDHLPTSCCNRVMVEAGLLMSYGTSILDFFRQSAFIPAASSRARSPPICRCYSRPNSNSSSTCRRRGRSASRYLTRSNCSPTK
jgi:putative ABC transport system substrate-binding protein